MSLEFSLLHPTKESFSYTSVPYSNLLLCCLCGVFQMNRASPALLLQLIVNAAHHPHHLLSYPHIIHHTRPKKRKKLKHLILKVI